MEFPATLPINKYLLKNNPAYEDKKTTIARLRAYYDGGESFPIDQELRKKPMEVAGSEGGANVRAVRIGAAVYTNYFGDTISDLVSNICKYPILIDTAPELDAYWASVEFNADGQSSSATEETRAALTDDFIYDRAFYLVKFPDKAAASFADQVAKGGALDAQYLHLDATLVTDWKPLASGGLEWARTYEKIPARSLDIGPYDKITHRWTYYAKDVIAVYEKTVDDTQETFDDADTAEIAGAPKPHELKACPVFKVNRKMRCAVGRKLLPTAKQLFNEESDASYLRFTTATGGLMIFTDQASKWKDGIVLSPMGAIIAGASDKIERDRVDAAMFAALDAACAARRGQLGGMIHTMARQTAQQSASGQNTSRASGAGMEKQAEPMEAWETGFAEPHLACWREMFKAVAAIREQDISGLSISGLMGDDEDESTDPVNLPQMQAEAIFAALPNVSDEAKEARGRQLGLCANEDADPATLKAIQGAKIEPPEPVPIPVPPVPPKEAA